MSPLNEGGPRKGRPDTTNQPGESYTAGPSEFDIPAHRLHPAEADLRRVMNTIRRERHSWWLYTWEGRYQREFLERLGRWAA